MHEPGSNIAWRNACTDQQGGRCEFKQLYNVVEHLLGAYNPRLMRSFDGCSRLTCNEYTCLCDHLTQPNGCQHHVLFHRRLLVVLMHKFAHGTVKIIGIAGPEPLRAFPFEMQYGSI